MIYLPGERHDTEVHEEAITVSMVGDNKKIYCSKLDDIYGLCFV